MGNRDKRGREKKKPKKKDIKVAYQPKSPTTVYRPTTPAQPQQPAEPPES